MGRYMFPNLATSPSPESRGDYQVSPLAPRGRTGRSRIYVTLGSLETHSDKRG
jgi:hypothetical protein